MKRRHLLLTALAACHLLMVGLGAMGIDFRTAKLPPTQALRLYAGLSGAGNRYGFFAPEVQTPTRAAFTMTSADGRQWEDTLQFGDTSEANLRLGTIAFMMPAMEESDQELLMRSFAATMLGRHRDAETVELRFEMFGVEGENDVVHEFPSMTEFREGRRPEWITLWKTPPFHRSLNPLP